MNILKGTANLLGKMTKFVVSTTSSSTSSIVAGFKEGYNGVEKTPVGPIESPDPAQTIPTKEEAEAELKEYLTKQPGEVVGYR